MSGSVVVQDEIRVGLNLYPEAELRPSPTIERKLHFATFADLQGDLRFREQPLLAAFRFEETNPRLDRGCTAGSDERIIDGELQSPPVQAVLAADTDFRFLAKFHERAGRRNRRTIDFKIELSAVVTRRFALAGEA